MLIGFDSPTFLSAPLKYRGHPLNRGAFQKNIELFPDGLLSRQIGNGQKEIFPADYEDLRRVDSRSTVPLFTKPDNSGSPVPIFHRDHKGYSEWRGFRFRRTQEPAFQKKI